MLEADNGVKAIELFRSHRSALRCVLLDLQMPVMDGWETAENLRSIEAGSQGTRMPIVACTALNLAEAWHDHDTVASSALHSGFDALLVSALVSPKPPAFERQKSAPVFLILYANTAYSRFPAVLASSFPLQHCNCPKQMQRPA